MNTENQIVQVKIEDIVPNRYQPRLKFNDQDLSELASSIRQYGIIEPLTLRPFDTKYEIIAGERRYRAAKLLGMQTVPAIIMNINDATSAELAIVENVQRKNLNAIEEARAYKKILEIENITQEELAKKIGKNQATISNKIRLLELATEVQDAVLNNQISERHARTILQLNNYESQKEVLKRIIEEKLTVKLTEELIQSNYKNSISNKNNIGDDNEMNDQNFNTLTNQPVGTIPETPLPQEQPQQPTNSMFNNNFFPSLEDEKTNMELNSFNAQPAEPTIPQTPTPEVSPMASNPMPEANVNPWDIPAPSVDPQPAPSPAPTDPLAGFVPAPEQPTPQEPTAPTVDGNNIPIGPNPMDFQNNQLNPEPAPSPAPIDPLAGFVPTPEQPVVQEPTNIGPFEPQNMNNIPQPELQPQNPLPGFIDQQSFNQPTPNVVPGLNSNTNELVPMIRKAISEIDPSGSKIQTSELDLDNEYQIIIKIPKGSI